MFMEVGLFTIAALIWLLGIAVTWMAVCLILATIWGIVSYLYHKVR